MNKETYCPFCDKTHSHDVFICTDCGRDTTSRFARIVKAVRKYWKVKNRIPVMTWELKRDLGYSKGWVSRAMLFIGWRISKSYVVSVVYFHPPLEKKGVGK